MGGRTQNKKARRLSTDSEGDDDYDIVSPHIKTQSKTMARSNNDGFVGGQIMQGKRARTMKKSYALETESEVESEILEHEEELENVEDDEDGNIDSLGPEDADADTGMYEIPSSLAANSKQIRTGKKNTISVKSKKATSIMMQKQNQMQQDASDDDELSELDSDLGEEEVTQMSLTGNIKIEEEDNDLDLEEENEEMDSYDAARSGSRISTPDLNKLTRRQRARFEDGNGGHLMALPDEVQVKKHLTAEEHAIRRAEMARRRKNLSEKRNEEEKVETINKLLKKQAPKTNTRRREVIVAVSGDGTPDDTLVPKPNPSYIRWVSSKDGNFIGIPQEWIDSPAGEIFKKKYSNVRCGEKND